MNKRNKLTPTIIITILMVSFVFVLLVITNRQKEVVTGFDITVVPSSSQIFLDGKKTSSGQITANPGKHSLVVTHANFDTYKSIVTSENNVVTLLPIGLKPSTPSGEKWKQDNMDEYLKLDGIVSQEYEKGSASVVKNYPIISELPQDLTPIFRIDYGVSKKYPTDSKKIAIYISSNNPANKRGALQYIYTMGYDPSDYEIIFENL